MNRKKKNETDCGQLRLCFLDSAACLPLLSSFWISVCSSRSLALSLTTTSSHNYVAGKPLVVDGERNQQPALQVPHVGVAFVIVPR